MIVLSDYYLLERGSHATRVGVNNFEWQTEISFRSTPMSEKKNETTR